MDTTSFSQTTPDLAPLVRIGDTERQCNVTALPPHLESAYQEFMAG